MIPILYDKTETAFTSEGLGRLSEITDIEVEEGRNGIFECEFEYPVSGSLYDQIEGNIVFVDHDATGDPQPFDVYRKTVPIDGMATFYGRHISYRLRKMTIMPFTATSAAEAINRIPQYIIGGSPFTFWTDKSVEKSFAVTYPRSVREVLLASEGSLLDVFGTGEYEWDKFNVKLHLHRGVDTGIEIRYGKNLTKFTQDRNSSETFNAVVPYWRDSESETLVTIPEQYVVSATKPEDEELQIVPLDLSEVYNEQPTEVQLRERATSYLSGTKTWKPAENIKVNFVQLWQTPEYQDYAPLERLRLCDSCNVIFTKAGVVAENVQIIRVVYNPLTERYTEMELGEPKKSLGSVIKASTEASVMAQVPTKSIMNEAIDRATLKLVGGTGGHIYHKLNADGEPEEILALNTDSIETATKVLRINYQGIGFSQNGINGPYTTAWTIDGDFVADFITTGILRGVEIIGESGRIGGFNMSSNNLSFTFTYEYPEFTQADLDKVQPYIVDPENHPLTDEEKLIYDVNMDGRVTSADLLAMQKMIIGTNPTYSSGVCSLNTADPRNILYIEITEGYGVGKYVSVGVGGINTSGAVIAQNYNAKGNLGVTPGNVWLPAYDAEVTGGLITDLTSNGVGTIVNGSLINVNMSGTWTDAMQISLSAGTWIIVYGVQITGIGAVTVALSTDATKHRASCSAPTGHTYWAKGCEVVTLAANTTVVAQTYSANLSRFDTWELYAYKLKG